MSFIFALLGLSIIVLVHEFGHYISARSAGIIVSEFSIGMGKSIVKKKWGETVFCLRIFPLGGYVRIPSLEDNEETIIKISFINKLKILLSGSLNNFLFAWIVFFFIFFLTGVPGQVSNIIENVSLNGPAYKAGLINGDVILSIDGLSVLTGKDVIGKLIETTINKRVIEIRRGDKDYTFNVSPKKEAGRNIVGISLKLEKEKAFSLVSAIKSSLEQCVGIVVITYKGLWMLITREIGVDQVYGPVGIITLTSQASSQGIIYFFSFLAILSINLSLINLFPFPALDGGRVLMLFISKVVGDKMSRRLENKLHFFGFIILILFVIYISYFDIQKMLLK